MTIYDAFLSLYRTIKEVAGINLNSRFVRVNIEYDTSFRRFESSTFLRNIPFCIEYPVMIVTFTILLLNKIIINACSDGRRLTEIHVCIFYRSNLTGSHKSTVHRSICISINGQ